MIKTLIFESPNLPKPYSFSSIGGLYGGLIETDGIELLPQAFLRLIGRGRQ